MSLSDTLKEAAKELARAVNALSFGPPTAYVYNPLDYAWEIHRRYLELAGEEKKKVEFETALDRCYSSFWVPQAWTVQEQWSSSPKS